MTDTERLDWLEEQDGCGLISDDAGRWAVTGDGMQNAPSRRRAGAISTSFVVMASEWRRSVREAIDAAMNACPYCLPTPQFPKARKKKGA